MVTVVDCSMIYSGRTTRDPRDNLTLRTNDSRSRFNRLISSDILLKLFVNLKYKMYICQLVNQYLVGNCWLRTLIKGRHGGTLFDLIDERHDHPPYTTAQEAMKAGSQAYQRLHVGVHLELVSD